MEFKFKNEKDWEFFTSMSGSIVIEHDYKTDWAVSDIEGFENPRDFKDKTKLTLPATATAVCNGDSRDIRIHCKYIDNGAYEYIRFEII
jgi:hypothetical protein